MGSKYIALVDRVFGPNWVSFEQYFYGNWDNAPIVFVFDILSKIIPSSILQYVFLTLIFVLWFVSMYYCLRRFTAVWRIQSIGALLFILTPWVYDRLFFWQVWVVAAYMFLPVVVWLAWDLTQRKLDLRYGFVMIATLVFLGMLNARYFPIGLVLLWSFFAYRLWKDRSLKVVYYGLMVLVGSVVLSLYWILPLLHSDIVSVLSDHAQIQFFTPEGSVGSLLLDTFALNNSWMNYKTRALVPLDTVLRFPWLFALLYGLLSFGWLFLWRQAAKFILLFWAIFSGFFSLSLATPFLANINMWVLSTIPFFSSYREPGKWMAVVAIFYILCIVILLTKTLGHWIRWFIWSLVAVLLWSSIYLFAVIPLEKDWTIQYPADRYQAKSLYPDILNSDNTIVLPWHWYLGCIFNDRRIIQNPAKTFFGPEIVYGDNMEGWGVYSYSTNPLSQDLTKILSNRKAPIDIAALLDVLRFHDIQHIAYFSSCASAPRYRWLLNVTDMVYSGTDIQLLSIPDL